MAGSRVEIAVEYATNEEFGDWLYEEMRVRPVVAAPDGEREAFDFGAVMPSTGGIVLPREEFDRDPGFAVARLFMERRRDYPPVVLAEYKPGDGVVSLRLGRHFPAGRAPRGAVVLG